MFKALAALFTATALCSAITYAVFVLLMTFLVVLEGTVVFVCVLFLSGVFGIILGGAVYGAFNSIHTFFASCNS